MKKRHITTLIALLAALGMLTVACSRPAPGFGAEVDRIPSTAQYALLLTPMSMHRAGDDNDAPADGYLLFLNEQAEIVGSVKTAGQRGAGLVKRGNTVFFPDREGVFTITPTGITKAKYGADESVFEHIYATDQGPVVMTNIGAKNGEYEVGVYRPDLGLANPIHAFVMNTGQCPDGTIRGISMPYKHSHTPGKRQGSIFTLNPTTLERSFTRIQGDPIAHHYMVGSFAVPCTSNGLYQLGTHTNNRDATIIHTTLAGQRTATATQCPPTIDIMSMPSSNAFVMLKNHFTWVNEKGQVVSVEPKTGTCELITTVTDIPNASHELVTRHHGTELSSALIVDNERLTLRETDLTKRTTTYTSPELTHPNLPNFVVTDLVNLTTQN